MRLDYVFSYWILAWYLLYIAKITKYNPKFVLILGIIENSFLLLFMIIYKTKISSIIIFIIINIFIKIIPYYTVRNDKIIKKDIIATIILFIIYCLWLYINTGNNVIEFHLKISESVIKDKNETPAMRFINYIVSKIKGS